MTETIVQDETQAPVAEFPRALKFLFEKHRYKVAKGGRGGTKSWGFARALLIQGAQRTMRVVCARETMKSIADSVHKLLGDQIQNMQMESFYQVQKKSITGINGTEFVFHGLKHNIDNIKSLEGCDAVWVEEAANVSKDSWDKLIPTVRKDGSEIWVSFNPELETDETYKRFVVNRQPGEVLVTVGWQDNPWFPSELRIHAEHLRLTDPESYAHVYGGECRSAVEGAVYAEEMRIALKEGRITSVPVDRTRPVDTFWDLGYADKTAIWFAQALPSGWYQVIDYLEDEGKTIDYYLMQLQKRAYLYGNDWLPHDSVDAIIHKNLASGDRSRSIEMLMRAAGRSVRMTPKLLVHDGINAARTILPQCRFDADKCADGLQALRRYQWGPLPASGVAKREPLHNEASHGADAFRGLALSIKQPRAPAPAPTAPMPSRNFAWG